MASNKDMRRADLVIPYVDPPKSGNEADMSSTLRTPSLMVHTWLVGTSHLMREKYNRYNVKHNAYGGNVHSEQGWLGESPEQKKTAATPAYMSVLMSLMALVVTYFPLFLPPQGKTAPAAAMPSA
ncbi:hypothetical protein N7456_000749 [Penicillium angulare]|uniref:Uncharacterized protein n=1 Tax=Penicillium angulare TaxID=116970 RepID=A0A9W9KSL6_9EURO|nr:hypothetical protein N7456_000749 [Penicillium angulare]